MSRGKLPLLSLFALLFILGACQSEGKIEGEVFIVTEGRENIEMGLVEVKAIQKEDFQRHLEERYTIAQKRVREIAETAAHRLDSLGVIQDRRSKLNEKRQAIEADLNQLQRKYSNIESSTDPLKSLIEESSTNIREDISVGDEIATYSEASVRVEPYLSKDNNIDEKVEAGSVGEVVKIDNTVGLYKIEFQDDIGWVQPIEIVPADKYYKWRESAEIERKSDIRIQIRRLKEDIRILANKIDKMDDKVGNLSGDLESSLQLIENHRNNAFFFNNLPNTKYTDETGSDGRYDLTVDAGISYYITAQAQRSLAGEEEKYYWMVETMVAGGEMKEVNLTNKNLGGVTDKKYALNDRTLSTVNEIWQAAIRLAKKGEEMEWEKLIYRTAFPKDSTEVPIPDDLNVPEAKLLSNR